VVGQAGGPSKHLDGECFFLCRDFVHGDLRAGKDLSLLTCSASFDIISTHNFMSCHPEEGHLLF